MNKVEVGQLLTIASGFDRFVTVDRVTTEAWFLVLGDVDYLDAQRAVVDHYTGPKAKETLAVRHILDSVKAGNRLTPAAIEEDVRAARYRGIIPADWPFNKPLTAEAAAWLKTARDRDRLIAAQYEIGE